MGKGFNDLLCRPRSGRGVAHVEVYDLAAVMKQDHEHVEHAKRHRGHHEEVDGDEISDVVLEEGSPGLRGRVQATRHERTNRALWNVETELEELAMDARRSPEGIAAGHGADELGDLPVDGRSPGSAPP